MVMNEYREWKAFVLITGMAILFSSCAVHRHSRPHRHHHHRHKVVFIAEQVTATGQTCLTWYGVRLRIGLIRVKIP